MPASLNSAPSTPASVYRPMVFDFERDDQTGAQVTEIRVADAADVTALGSGLAVGDILVEHAAPLDGTPVPIAEGQTVLIRRCGLYNGIKKVLKVIDQDGSAPDYMVIEAPDYGTVTPSTGSIRVWLDRYALVCEVSVYEYVGSDPVVLLLTGTADNAGNIRIDVSKPLRDYFTKPLNQFGLPISGGMVAQDAHAFTATFYRVRIAETYALPGEPYPTDAFIGALGSDILLDDFEDEDAPYYRVAVNAVHPYQRNDEAGNPLLTWAELTLSAYEIDGVNVREALTYAPRNLTMADTDHFRLHYLTPSTHPTHDPFTVNFLLKVFSVADNGTETLVDTIPFDFSATEMAAVSIGIGPADLEPFITVPAKYNVSLCASEDDTIRLGQKYYITVDSTCKEVRRPIIVQNLLGGADHYSFTGREVVSTKAGTMQALLSSAPMPKDVRLWVGENLTARGKVATIEKPYSGGVGTDWTERVYKGPNAILRLSSTRTAPIIIETDETIRNSGPLLRPLTINYRLGVDQISQQS